MQVVVQLPGLITDPQVVRLITDQIMKDHEIRQQDLIHATDRLALEQLPEATEFEAEEVHAAGSEVVVVGAKTDDRVAWRGTIANGELVTTLGPKDADDTQRLIAAYLGR